MYLKFKCEIWHSAESSNYKINLLHRAAIKIKAHNKTIFINSAHKTSYLHLSSLLTLRNPFKFIF